MASVTEQHMEETTPAGVEVQGQDLVLQGKFHAPHAAVLLSDYPLEVWPQFVERWIEGGGRPAREVVD